MSICRKNCKIKYDTYAICFLFQCNKIFKQDEGTYDVRYIIYVPENNDYLGSRTCEKYHIWFPLIFLFLVHGLKWNTIFWSVKLNMLILLGKGILFSHSTLVLFMKLEWVIPMRYNSFIRMIKKSKMNYIIW